MIPFKQKIYAHYHQLIHEKVERLQQVLADLKESGANETKSTAGDKHETALAMLQIEQANTREQLEKIMQQKRALEKINPAVTAPMVANGSLLKTNQGYLYISIAGGKAVIDGVTVMALSPQSPLGIQLMGLQKGAAAKVNNTSYIIENIE